MPSYRLTEITQCNPVRFLEDAVIVEIIADATDGRQYTYIAHWDMANDTYTPITVEFEHIEDENIDGNK